MGAPSAEQHGDAMAVDVAESAAVDFEAECALLELACTQPDVHEQASDELTAAEWEAELALLAASKQSDAGGLEEGGDEQHEGQQASAPVPEEPWSKDEDHRLTALMFERRPTDSWSVIAVALGGDRSVTSCSRRWGAINGMYGDAIREGSRRAAREFLEQAVALGPENEGALSATRPGLNLRILSTASVSVVPFEVPPDEFALLVANLPRFIEEETLQRMFATFGAVYEIQLRPQVGSGGTHCFVRFYSSHDAHAAFDALDGKFVRGHRIRICVGLKRDRSVGRALTPLGPEHAVALLQYYLPLSFSTSIVELDLASEDRVTGREAGPADAAEIGCGYWCCRYTATVSVQLHQRRGSERDTSLGSAEGEHTDSSRGTARAVSMKRAKRLALQEAFNGLVLVIDHIEGAAVVLFDDEL